MRKYEVMYIICLSIDDEVKKVLVECFNGVLIDNGVEIVNVKEWGKCCLVYEINDFCDGYYMIFDVVVILEVVFEFDCFVKINEDIICYIVVK